MCRRSRNHGSIAIHGMGRLCCQNQSDPNRPAFEPFHDCLPRIADAPTRQPHTRDVTQVVNGSRRDVKCLCHAAFVPKFRLFAFVVHRCRHVLPFARRKRVSLPRAFLLQDARTVIERRGSSPKSRPGEMLETAQIRGQALEESLRAPKSETAERKGNSGGVAGKERRERFGKQCVALPIFGFNLPLGLAEVLGGDAGQALPVFVTEQRR